MVCDSQASWRDARELLLHEQLHVALKLLEPQLVVLIQVDLPLNLSPDFILDVALAAGVLIEGLADLNLADSATIVGVHDDECLLQVMRL